MKTLLPALSRVWAGWQARSTGRVRPGRDRHEKSGVPSPKPPVDPWKLHELPIIGVL